MAIRDYQWGCGFTEGFRVPLLVVSPYTPPGYVSGACVGTSCTNDQFPYQHDFGSILAFTEYNFTMQFIAKPFYADYNAPDGPPTILRMCRYQISSAAPHTTSPTYRYRRSTSTSASNISPTACRVGCPRHRIRID